MEAVVGADEIHETAGNLVVSPGRRQQLASKVGVVGTLPVV